MKRALIAPLTALVVGTGGVAAAFASGVLDHPKPHCPSWTQPVSAANTYGIPVDMWDRDGQLPRQLVPAGRTIVWSVPAPGTDATATDTLYVTAANGTSGVGHTEFTVKRPATC